MSNFTPEQPPTFHRGERAIAFEEGRVQGARELRDDFAMEFAKAAMAVDRTHRWGNVGVDAYRFADLMMKARAK